MPASLQISIHKMVFYIILKFHFYLLVILRTFLFCREARSAVEYALKYTETCQYEDLASFRSRVQFTVDFISQACQEDKELVEWARCSLRGRKYVEKGCDLNNISECLTLGTSSGDNCQ